MNWLVFGTSYLDEEPDDGSTMLETYIRSDATLDKHVKSFLRLPASVSYIGNPHAYVLHDMSRSVSANGERVDAEAPWFVENTPSFGNYGAHAVSAYIAHYLFQAYGTYFKRKVTRLRDDSYKPHTTLDRTSAHLNYNTAVTTDVRDKYNAANKIAMSAVLAQQQQQQALHNPPLPPQMLLSGSSSSPPMSQLYASTPTSVLTIYNSHDVMDVLQATAPISLRPLTVIKALNTRSCGRVEFARTSSCELGEPVSTPESAANQAHVLLTVIEPRSCDTNDTATLSEEKGEEKTINLPSLPESLLQTENNQAHT